MKFRDSKTSKFSDLTHTLYGPDMSKPRKFDIKPKKVKRSELPDHIIKSKRYMKHGPHKQKNLFKDVYYKRHPAEKQRMINKLKK